MRDAVARAIDRAYEHLDRDEIGQAVDALQTVLDGGGQGVGEAWVVMAEVRRAAGDQPGAVAAAESALGTGEAMAPEDWTTVTRVLTEAPGDPAVLDRLADLLDRAAEESPDAAAVYVARGILRLTLRRDNAALDEFAFATDLDGDSLDGWLGAAEAQLRLDLHDGAAESFAAAAELAPEVADYWVSAGEAALAAGNAVLAASAFDEAVRLGSTAVARPGRAKAALALGIPADAAEDLEGALAESPEDAELWELLGEARYELSDDEGAAQAFGRSAELGPDRSSAWRNLGEANWNAGRLESAEEALRRAAALDPHDAESRMSLAQLLLEMGRTDDAVAAARDALALDESAADAVVVLARARLGAGDAAGAREALDSGLESSPEAVVLYVERARVLAEQGFTGLAARDLGWALESEPDYAEAIGMRGRLALESGDLEAADADLANAVSLDPQSGEMWVWHGRARALLGYPDDARLAWEQAVSRLAPADPLRARAVAWRAELDEGVVT